MRSSRPLHWHLVWLIVVAVVPVMLFSAAMVYRVIQHERGVLEQRLEYAAEQLAGAIDTELRQVITTLEVLGLSNALADGDLKAFHAVATRVTEAQPTLASVVLLGANGEHLVNPRVPFGTPLPPLLQPELPLAAVRSGSPVISDIVAGSVTRRLLTAVYVPVLIRGEPRYVLVAAMESGNWQALIAARLPAGAQAALMDRQAQIIAATDGARLEGGRPAPFMAVLASEPPGRRVVRIDDISALAAHRRSSVAGWTVATFTPAAEALSPLRASLVWLGGGFLLLLMGGVSLAVLYARRISGAIAEHVESVRAVGDGKPPGRLRGRIGELQEASTALADAAALLRRRLEHEESARSQVAAAARAKDEFLAVLGHELRNPLAPIRSAIEILRRCDPAGDEARWARGVIDRQSAHLARLVDDLLDVTRIERGKTDLRIERVNLRQLAEQAVRDYEPGAAAAGLRLQLDAGATPIWVDADPVRVTQIIGNLLRNAETFTPAGGSVTLSVRHVGAQAIIRVKDTGVGIEPALLERVFLPFVQGPQDMARSPGGLGLGLALVKGLAELHGGSVQARSDGKGQGAELIVALPSASPPDEP